MRKFLLLTAAFCSLSAYAGAGMTGSYYYHRVDISSQNTASFGGGQQGGGGGGLTLNAFSTNTSASDNLTFTYTASAQNNRLGVVACGSSQSGTFVSSASWAGVLMYEATRTERANFGAGYAIIWVATGIPAGNSVVTVTKSLDSGSDINCATYDFYNAEQDPGKGFTEPAGKQRIDLTTSISTFCASNLGEIIVDAVTVETNVSAMVPDAGQEMRVSIPASTNHRFGSSTKGAAASKTAMGWTWTGDNNAEQASISIRPAP